MTLKGRLLAHLLQLALLTSFTDARTIRYTFDVSYLSGNPDGVWTTTILGINGQFPGPPIEGEVGDFLEVNVINNIQDGQNVTIHWHGIHQRGTPFEDGPAQITQCPIKKGSYQVYSFPLLQQGTFWYHSHVNSQYTEGLWGALIVRNKPEVYEADYDEEILITLNDWYHTSARKNEEYYISPRAVGPPYPFSMLMNGMGRYPCDVARAAGRLCNPSAQRRPVYHVQPGKTYRVRLINVSAWVAFNFTIEGHTMPAIEVDGIDSIKTRPVESCFIAAGQRYSFLLTVPTTGQVGSQFLIRANMRHEYIFWREGNINPDRDAVIHEVTGVLEYSSTQSPAGGSYQKILVPSQINFDYTRENNPTKYWHEMTFLQELDTLPYDHQKAPFFYDKNVNLEVTFDKVGNITRGSFNHTPFELTHEMPQLGMMVNGIAMPEKTFPVYLKYGEIVQIVIYNPGGPHPMHLHGHHFWVMRQGSDGEGSYNPLRHRLDYQGHMRDTILIKNNSFLVLRFKADNIGVWTLHCHIDWHNLSGMAMTFVEAPELAYKLRIPAEARGVCGEHGVRL